MTFIPIVIFTIFVKNDNTLNLWGMFWQIMHFLCLSSEQIKCPNIYVQVNGLSEKFEDIVCWCYGVIVAISYKTAWGTIVHLTEPCLSSSLILPRAVWTHNCRFNFGDYRIWILFCQYTVIWTQHPLSKHTLRDLSDNMWPCLKISFPQPLGDKHHKGTLPNTPPR